MKFTISALTTALLASIGSADAFVVGKQQSVVANHLAATVEKSEVIPPPSSKDEETVKAEYDSNVQCTYGRYPLTIDKGQGCKLWTTDGKEYLDFVSGIATCALGHAHPVLTKAIVDQMNEVHHVSNLYFIPAQANLAKWLCDNSVADKAFFCNSGAEANEAAIKLARRHASNRGITKPVIITAISSFHGRTLSALSATAQPKYHKGFTYDGEMVQGFEYVPYNDIEALEAKVNEINNSEEGRGVAAVMLEALQGEGGIIPGDKEFFAKARQLTTDCGALLMCDEVQVGVGRSGKLWGYENLDIEPDVFTSAKALGGGVPIGAMMARGEAANTFGPGDHASTYGGNPLACSAGLAVAKVISEENLLENVRERGEQLSSGLEAIAAKYPNILGEVRGWGLLKGVVIQDSAGCTAGELVGDAMKSGLLLVPAGTNVCRFVPPLIVSEQDINNALEMFEQAVAARAAGDSDAKP
mmetsp:Transcript_23324/g.32579  ORF Transcript_23324/g.32579 Transcript_23324/m.32579 type:complete len:471 (-) Transcript_23324:127-1539(-)